MALIDIVTTGDGYRKLNRGPVGHFVRDGESKGVIKTRCDIGIKVSKFNGAVGDGDVFRLAGQCDGTGGSLGVAYVFQDEVKSSIFAEIELCSLVGKGVFIDDDVGTVGRNDFDVGLITEVVLSSDGESQNGWRNL